MSSLKYVCRTQNLMIGYDNEIMQSIYCFSIALLIIQQCAANQIGHIPRYEDGKYTLYKHGERYIMINVFTTKGI